MSPRSGPGLAFAALLAACSGAPAETAAEAATLRFSAIPDQNTTLLQERYAPVTLHLAAALDVPVEYVPASDYGASVEMFKNGDVQLAWFGGLTGVQARKAVPGARAVAQGVEDPQYFSYFIAHPDAGLAPSEDFPVGIGAVPFTFGSESSTSGRLMPEFFIRESTGKAPADFFSEPYGFSGAHDRTAKLVESGQVQAGALSYKTYDKLVEKGEIDPAKAQVIWKTPPYADYNFTVHPSVEETYGAGFGDRLAAVLLEMPPLLVESAFSRSGMIAASDEDYGRIAEVATQLDMLR